MLFEMARMAIEDEPGSMTLHPAAFRNHHAHVPDVRGGRGGDVPMSVEATRSLRPMLEAFGTNATFRLVVFTMDETIYGRELGPLAATLDVRRRAVVVHRRAGRHQALPQGAHRTRGLHQDVGLHRRHPRVPVDPGPSTCRAAWTVSTWPSWSCFQARGQGADAVHGLVATDK